MSTGLIKPEPGPARMLPVLRRAFFKGSEVMVADHPHAHTQPELAPHTQDRFPPPNKRSGNWRSILASHMVHSSLPFAWSLCWQTRQHSAGFNAAITYSSQTLCSFPGQTNGRTLSLLSGLLYALQFHVHLHTCTHIKVLWVNTREVPVDPVFWSSLSSFPPHKGPKVRTLLRVSLATKSRLCIRR